MIPDTLDNNVVSIADRREAAQQAERAAAEPIFTLEEYQAKRAEGYLKGYAEGFEESRATAFKEASDKAYSESYVDGVEKGKKAARERLRAILTSDAAKGREALAWSLAFDMADLAPDQALGLLAKAPVAVAPAAAATSGLLAEMSAMRQPSIGAAPPSSAGGMSEFESGAAAARALLGA
jgi:hypothetical protein